jgi:hypothetical protein
VEDDATVLSALMLGLAGFVVLAAAEYGGELELLVESAETVAGCPGVWCAGHRARPPRPSGAGR